MDILRIFGGTARLTRFITADTLGFWTLVTPARRWASLNEEEHVSEEEPRPDAGWRSKLVSGLDCPFCVGFWVGALVLVSYSIARRSSLTLALWRGVMDALSLNYIVGHVVSKLD